MTDEKKLPCKGSKNGLHFPSGHDVAAALGFDHKCGYCKKYYNDADNFLPVSPSKLPWNNALSILRPALLNTPERVIKYLHGFVLVPESEADKLRERVKKFEEAAKMILELDESHRLFEHNCFYYTDPAESGHKWISATKLLREAMGEK